jgi:hypothetical protein
MYDIETFTGILEFIDRNKDSLMNDVRKAYAYGFADALLEERKIAPMEHTDIIQFILDFKFK